VTRKYSAAVPDTREGTKPFGGGDKKKVKRGKRLKIKGKKKKEREREAFFF